MADLAAAPRRFVGVVASAVGVSIGVQALAFVRQVLIAAYFGISRDLDVYLVAYAVATIVAFTFSATFDSAVVPRLVQTRAVRGDAGFQSLATALFRVSCGLGLAAAAALIAVTPLLVPLVATGFDVGERGAVSELVWSFAPWVVLCLPYYAAAAWHKSRRAFNRVFAAELLIGVVSIAVLVSVHDRVEILPLAYAAGYGAALVLLVAGTGLLSLSGGRADGVGAVLRSVGELYVANQTGSVTAMIDRHYQSLVPPGGIAAVGFAGQIITGLTGLLTFREIYIVPLSEHERRDEKLERLLIGLVVLAIPASVFGLCFAYEATDILFRRGRFDADAARVTADVLGVYILSVVPSVVTTPLARMLLIVDRVSWMHLYYLASAAILAAGGYVFVRVLDLGTQGVAWMLLVNAVGGCAAMAVLTGRFGIRPRWGRVLRYAVYAGFAAAVAFLCARLAAAPFVSSWARLAAGTPAYGAVVAMLFFIVRSRLRTISG
ncbi:MAG: lipid II flippase MurJ [Gemmatimonas sp.]